MYSVWTQNGITRLKVAASDTLPDAIRYAVQYRSEGRVTIKRGKRIVAIFSQTNTG